MRSKNRETVLLPRLDHRKAEAVKCYAEQYGNRTATVRESVSSGASNTLPALPHGRGPGNSLPPASCLLLFPNRDRKGVGVFLVPAPLSLRSLPVAVRFM